VEGLVSLCVFYRQARARSLPPLPWANYLAAFVVSTAFVESHFALQLSTLQESVTGVVASVLAPELQAANANATAATRMNFFMFVLFLVFG